MKFRSSLMITLMFRVFLCEGDCIKDKCKDCIKDKCKDWNNLLSRDCIKDKCKDWNNLLSRGLVTNDNQTSPIEYSNCADCVDNCKDFVESDDLCQALCYDICSPCSLSSDCERILLIDGGFTGQIQSIYTNQTCVGNNSDHSICKNMFNGSSPFNISTCILSFDTQKETNRDCSFLNSGVWLVNDTKNNTLQINITRNPTIRPKTPICFVKGAQSCVQINDAYNCTQTKGGPTTCGNMTCLDPTKICEKATYTNSCIGTDSNDDIISLIGGSAVCRKCGDPFQKTEGKVVLNFTLPGGSSSNCSYSDTMKTLNKMILDEMGNKSSVSVSMDNITGIFVKQQNKEDFNPIYFIYCTKANFNIIEDKTQMQTFERTFSVPKEAFEKAMNISNETLFASLLRFPSFPKDYMNSTLLNNEVYSIDMGKEIANLTNTFNLTFRNISLKSADLVCNSWNGQGATPIWTTDGCNTSYVNGEVTCLCQHLTFFAVLMTLPNSKISTSDLNNLTFITSIGCGLSLFFLSIALFMHYLLRRGQASVSVHILINLFVALFLLNLSFLVNESVARTGDEIGCKLMAGTMHYFMLSTFTWFGLQALHLCLQLTQNVAGIQNYVTKLCIAGWVPAALVMTGIFISQKYGKVFIVSDTGKTASMCWITDQTLHYLVNIGYYSAIFLFTFLTFVVMLRWLWLLRRKSPTITFSGKRSRPSDALTIMGLCCILGLSWGFAFFTYGPMQIPAYYIFSILNSCQGLFLFVYYYKSSRQADEAETLETESSTTTVVENPYNKPKMF
ncbi:adhesion G-protein coupled receptor G2 isoform X2 [Tachysurus fulvidraco]|uniref:adhesion G-protein coupled receptor G2 isoform X2 n=1 Tax=Tachysurus fulvidraco TaxID=1234273 RepID=UPI001FED3E9E|nr:adhesion G-protein coupled receptor G2 isoform X2 [Tachysurus fulvidraco]